MQGRTEPHGLPGLRHLLLCGYDDGFRNVLIFAPFLNLSRQRSITRLGRGARLDG
jgi:hypothetical protein